MTLTEWLLLVVIVADLGSFLTTQARLCTAEADIRDLKSNSNKIREASLALVEVIREMGESAPSEGAAHTCGGRPESTGEEVCPACITRRDEERARWAREDASARDELERQKDGG